MNTAAGSPSVIQGCFPRGLPRAGQVAAAVQPFAANATPAWVQACIGTHGAPQPIQRQTAPAARVVPLPSAHHPHAVQLSAQMASTFATHGGAPLPPQVRQMMEAAFGVSFGDVRVHVGPHVAALGATSFTQGSNIHFAPGHYDPHTRPGQQTLGRELAHVVQQRTGRVRNPFGGGVAVIADPFLEREAERLVMRVTTAPATVQRTAVRVSLPMAVAPATFRIAARADGREVGSVMVHAHDRATVEVSDLAVLPSHRKQGIGAALMASAAKAGVQLGRTHVALTSDDDGSGALTRWYQTMGFQHAGRTRGGMAHMQAPIGRVLAGVAQGKFAAVHSVSIHTTNAVLQLARGRGGSVATHSATTTATTTTIPDNINRLGIAPRKAKNLLL
jgi:GNAT superfamily N-acetyltransferase